MKNISFNIKSKFVSYTFLFLACIAIFSCTDKKRSAAADKMELAFEREMTAQSVYENDRMLKRIEKEIADNGNRAAEVAIRDQVEHVLNVRNKYIDSVGRVDELMDNIKHITRLVRDENKKDNTLALLDYYQEELKEKKDSLLFQKFINVYLIFEKATLDEYLGMITSCNWGMGLTSHIIKTADTIQVGKVYEFTIVPDRYDYKTSYVHNDCEMSVYRNDVAIEVKPAVIKRGSVFLVSVILTQPGSYKIKGTYTQRAYSHSYVFKNYFSDAVVVK